MMYHYIMKYFQIVLQQFEEKIIVVHSLRCRFNLSHFLVLIHKHKIVIPVSKINY